jgi:hypothetical protein
MAERNLYVVLGVSPALPRRHGERLRRVEARPVERQPAPRWSEPARPEPLRPEPLRVMGDPEAIHPSFAEVYDRLLRNFTCVGVPKAERVEPLAFDLVLTPEEAARGGVLPVNVPAFARCPACDGSGQEWAFTCLRCDGQGLVEDERTVGVRIPPLTEEHAVIEVPLEGLGIANLRLRLHVQIGA